jgi:hypothetical protein
MKQKHEYIMLKLSHFIPIPFNEFIVVTISNYPIDTSSPTAESHMSGRESQLIFICGIAFEFHARGFFHSIHRRQFDTFSLTFLLIPSHRFMFHQSQPETLLLSFFSKKTSTGDKPSQNPVSSFPLTFCSF